MTKTFAVTGMILFGLILFGCGNSNPEQGAVSQPPSLGGVNVPLYKDGANDALKNWPPPADTTMGDSNTPRQIQITGVHNIVLPNNGGTIEADTSTPNCPNPPAPAGWPHPGNKRDITVKNSCAFPIWIGLQADTILPAFCSADKSTCSAAGDCTTVITQTCSEGVCSETTKSCTTDTDCDAVTQVCVTNAKGDGFKLASGESKVYKLPNVWVSGALWGRTKCRDCTPDQPGPRCCETGDAGGTLYNRDGRSGDSNGKAQNPETPSTKIELNFPGTLDNNGSRNPDVYDMSQVDGFNLPAQMMPVPGTGDDRTKPTGYWFGCPGVTGNVNNVCPDAAMIQDTDKYPFGSAFPLGIAQKSADGKATIACFNGCSYKTRGSCKSDNLPCRKDQDCAVLNVCSRDDQPCTENSDCAQKPDPQACVKKSQSCIPPPGKPTLLPEAADYCCDALKYCGTHDSDKDCKDKGKTRCPATAIAAFYKALAPSAYAYTQGEDDWSTFNAGLKFVDEAKDWVGPDYYIEFCPHPGK